jgi:multicomponent Na+:H+ antiporter subunit C
VTQSLFFSLIAAGLFGIAIYSFLAYDHLLRKILALNVMGSAVFLLLVAFARKDSTTVDPVPHAMVLTGIVIAVSATAFALALLQHFHRETGQTRLDDGYDNESQR